jgi:YVTN family beta-propeller protein
MKHYPVLLASLLLLTATSPLWADDDDVPGLDVPGQEQKLNAQLWSFAKDTDYAQVQQTLQATQAESKTHIPMEVTLPNGWRMAPAGTQLELGRYPMVLVPFAGKLVVLNNGYYVETKPEISVCDADGTQIEKTLTVPSLFPSARVGKDGDLYVSGGYDQNVRRFNTQFENVKDYPMGGFTAGLAPMDSDHVAVAYMLIDNGKGGYNAPGKLAILNTQSGKIEDEVECGRMPQAVESLDGKIFVGLLSDNQVRVYERRTKLKLKQSIPVGKSPSAFAADPANHRLYVFNQDSDEVSVIDTETLKVTDTWNLKQKDFKFGVAPTSGAVEGGSLFVTLSRLNAVAVLDTADGHVEGYIPTGWYPTSVVADKGKLLFLSSKGIHERRPNLNGPQPTKNREEPGYVLTLLKGSLGRVDIAALDANLSAWTDQVTNSSPLFDTAQGFKMPIKHIFYIVKENRTYDQVLGDLGKGNGDPDLTIFGKDITPNEHQLANEFVDLDNFYVDGEISVFGHNYTTSAYVSPFMEWLGMNDYSGRMGAKDAKNPAKNEDFWPFGTAPFTFSPAFIWDSMDARKVNYRIYGEDIYVYAKPYRLIVDKFGETSDLAKKCYDQYMFFSKDKKRDTVFNEAMKNYIDQNNSPDDCAKLLDNPDFLTTLSNFYSGGDSLAKAIGADPDFKTQWADFLYHYSFNFPGWDLKFSDLSRVEIWKKDFERQIKDNQVFTFQYLWLPNDHTAGTAVSMLNPYQFVAQNDSAVGVVVNTIAKSPVWKDSLIFVLEDDSQNGPDHVDAMRSPAFAAGPYVKHGEVISDIYDQLGMFKTIEMILGLPPLNFNDGSAAPMFSIFTDKPDFRRYVLPRHSKQLTPEDLKIYERLLKNQ